MADFTQRAAEARMQVEPQVEVQAELEVEVMCWRKPELLALGRARGLRVWCPRRAHERMSNRGREEGGGRRAWSYLMWEGRDGIRRGSGRMGRVRARGRRG